MRSEHNSPPNCQRSTFNHERDREFFDQATIHTTLVLHRTPLGVDKLFRSFHNHLFSFACFIHILPGLKSPLCTSLHMGEFNSSLSRTVAYRDLQLCSLRTTIFGVRQDQYLHEPETPILTYIPRVPSPPWFLPSSHLSRLTNWFHSWLASAKLLVLSAAGSVASRRWHFPQSFASSPTP